MKIQAVSLPLTLLHAESCVAMATTSFIVPFKPALLHLYFTRWRPFNGEAPYLFSLPLSLCAGTLKSFASDHAADRAPACGSAGFFQGAGDAAASPLRASEWKECGHATAEYFLSVFLTPTDAQRRLDSFLRRCLPNRREKKLSESRLTLRALLSSKKINH